MSERPARPAHEDILWLGDYLPYRLGVVASRMLREAAQVYKRRADPVTTPQFRALAILANHEPLTATEICRLSMLHKVAISRALSQLQRRGLVMRSKILDDRRASHVTLTAQGWRYYTAIVPEMKRQEEALRRALTPQDLKRLFRMLEQFDEFHRTNACTR
jgi:DNA-binding MarR family transcriptional regulator